MTKPFRWLSNRGQAKNPTNPATSQASYQQRVDSAISRTKKANFQAWKNNQARTQAGRRGGNPLQNVLPSDVPDRIPGNIKNQYYNALGQNREALNNVDKEAARAIERLRQQQAGGSTGLNNPKGQGSSIGGSSSRPSVPPGGSRGGVSATWQLRVPNVPSGVSKIGSIGLKGLGVISEVSALATEVPKVPGAIYQLGHASLGAGLATLGFLPVVRKQHWWQDAAQAWVDMTQQRSEGKRNAFMQEVMEPPSVEVLEKTVYPFTGGQMPGVLYQVAVQTRTSDARNISDSQTTYQVVGRIHGLRITVTNRGQIGSGPYAGYWYLNVRIALITDSNPDYGLQTSGFIEGNGFAKIVSISRADGLPDTGGNPPPTTEETTTSRPTNTVAIGYALAAPTAPAIEEPTTQPTEEERPRTPFAPVIVPNAVRVPNSTTTPTLVPTTTPTTTPVNDPTGNPIPEKTTTPTSNPIYRPIEQGTAIEEEKIKQNIPTGQNGLSFPGLPIGVPIRDGSYPGNKYQPTPSKGVTTTPQLSNCQLTNRCVLSEIGNLQNSNSQLGGKIDVVNAGLQGLDLSLLKVINEKLGPQIGDAAVGISGFMKKAWKSTRLNKVLDAINTLLLIHNAAILSRNLGQTLGELTSQALAVIGIKDEEDNPIDINSIIGKTVDSWIAGIVGEEIWKGTKETFNKASRIISSTTNIIWNIRSIGDSAREIAEWTAENTGKIGNALKKYRVVAEDAYKWMPEQVKATDAWTRKIDRFRSGIDSLDDASSSFSGALSEVQTIQEEFKQLDEQKQEFDKNISELIPSKREENKPRKEQSDAEKLASAAPQDTASVFRGEGES
jgi:hypothetical protein